MEKDMKDKIIECKECGKKFVFPAKIELQAVINRNLGEDLYAPSKVEFKDTFDGKMTEEKIRFLFQKRDDLQDQIMKLNEKGESYSAKVLEQEFNILERHIIALSNGNSQEAYNFLGFTNDPVRCPECKIKNSAKRQQPYGERTSKRR